MKFSKLVYQRVNNNNNNQKVRIIMSTYTDLHNKIKETITVDYKDRVTTQPVKFLNGKNEYWGTLKGEISAENISINGGVLENVTIINPKLEGSFNLPEGVDLVQTAKDIAAISNDLIQTRQNLADELTARYHFDKIESETRASADIELKEAIKNAAISVNNVNDTLRKEFEDADKTLSVHFEGITDKLSNSFEEADKNIKDSLKTITNQLSDDIISVRMDLGKESYNLLMARLREDYRKLDTAWLSSIKPKYIIPNEEVIDETYQSYLRFKGICDWINKVFNYECVKDVNPFTNDCIS